MSKLNIEEGLPKAYEPSFVEPSWYTFWERHNLFQPNADGSSSGSCSKRPSFCVSIPPPNVTGRLHMGHAIGDTLQDVLIRWKRMQGDCDVLWVPGTDHAGIATQTVVERDLMARTGKTRRDCNRQEFLDLVWSWKEKSQEHILNQIKRLGCSCDWSRLRFTMDDGCNIAVRRAFKKLFDEGLIYRGDYLVNWDPLTQTALADDEVEYEEREGKLWTVRYPLASGQGYLSIATTRPETMLGDVAIAVNPSDERYTHLIGQQVILPLLNRMIPIIADHYVNPEFGTGAVKITPAHDPNDYQMGLRHNLPQINVMTTDGRINETGAQFAGQTIQEARQSVVEALDLLGLLEKIEPHQHRVGISYRSKAVIEPLLSKQWFVKLSAFAPAMRSAVTEGKVKLQPSHWEATYFHWIDHLRDWCISRQLWWGHRIPIWYNKDNSEQMICYDGEGLPAEVEANPELWKQEEDVLDTWFSAALWPLSVLGWPDKTPDLDHYYPNALLVTGHDILFFWVARMIMMGEYLTGQPPFQQVFLHGLIFAKSYWRKNKQGQIAYVSEQERIQYDLGKEQIPKDVEFRWEKMSKTKGNVIDPIEIIDQYGADAMRMALCASASTARQIDLDRRRFEEFKNFANKLWNGARFVLLHLQHNQQHSGLSKESFLKGFEADQLQLEDRWILAKLDDTVAEVNGYLERYAFDQAAALAYEFFWQKFCAYYVEIAKAALQRGEQQQREVKLKLLAILLCQAVRLIHPMAPFISEELFSRLKNSLALEEADVADVEADCYTKECLKALQSKACMVAPYPKPMSQEGVKQQALAEFSLFEQLIYTIRNVRAEMQLPPSEQIDVYIGGEGRKELREHVKASMHIIKALIRVKEIEFVESLPDGFGARGMVASLKVFVPLPNHLRPKERDRLEKERAKIQKSLEGVKKRLDDGSFKEKAPAELVEEMQIQAASLLGRLEHIEQTMQQLMGEGV